MALPYGNKALLTLKYQNMSSKKRSISGIAWDDDVLEMINEAKKLDPNFNLGEIVNTAVRKHGDSVLREMAEEQKKVADQTLAFVEKRTKAAKKRSQAG